MSPGGEAPSSERRSQTGHHTGGLGLGPQEKHELPVRASQRTGSSQARAPGRIRTCAFASGGRRLVTRWPLVDQLEHRCWLVMLQYFGTYSVGLRTLAPPTSLVRNEPRQVARCARRYRCAARPGRHRRQLESYTSLVAGSASGGAGQNDTTLARRGAISRHCRQRPRGPTSDNACWAARRLSCQIAAAFERRIVGGVGAADLARPAGTRGDAAKCGRLRDVADLDSQPKSIQSLYSWYSQDLLFVNRRYQRKLVWTLEEKQKLVESILRKYPVPAILLAERAGGTYEIIDGLQRLHALMSFVENAFPTLEEEFFDADQFPTAKARIGGLGLELDSARSLVGITDVSTYLDYSMAVSVMRGATEQEIDDVFARINTYGHRLSDQERRQAGVQDEFSGLVRSLSCSIRGDASSNEIKLSQMPSISIDLPRTKHGYEVVADEVFWVEQGILRSTDLRDSMDEQCIADIAASIVGGQLIERSKEALDKAYDAQNNENGRLVAALSVYGADRFESEFKYCIDEVLKVCNAGGPQRLRNVLFAKRSTNPFPAIFAVLFIAFHESLVQGNKVIADYVGVKKAISEIA